MNKLVKLLIMSIVASLSCLAQEKDENILWITLNQESFKPFNESVYNYKSRDDIFNTFLEKYNVIRYFKAMPFAKTPALREIYTIECKGNASALKLDLESKFNRSITAVRQFFKPTYLYDPSDHMWELTLGDTTDWLWHLYKVKANYAWDITHGSPEVKIAIVDEWFDNEHPDLANKIDPPFDPYDSVYHSSDCNQSQHGTAVASFAGAETDGGGQLASTGFNTRLICYNGYGSRLAKALHSSTVMNADVLSISWIANEGGCYPSANNRYQDSLIVKEILDNGTVIVSAAGNGSLDCNGGEVYPFSPQYDERIIKVTSTDTNDYHTYFVDDIDKTHTHVSNVDICAPGYCLMTAKRTTYLSGGICVAREWPYYGCETGTSFAAPIVAGVCALMKSVNPCLTPSQVQSIVKCTADTVWDANLYQGLIGTGRINAYEAVKRAATKFVQNQNFSSAYTITAHILEVGNHVTSDLTYGNVVINNGANITLNGRLYVLLNEGFEVTGNSVFAVNIDPDIEIPCN